MEMFYVVVVIILFNFSSVAMASLGNRPLKMNVQGDDVRELQERLVLFGYDVEVDGVFGSKTRIAVSLFQRDNGLREDGIAGPETVALLTSVASYFEYTVQRGDSLYALAKQYNTEVKDIINLNNLKHSVIYVGQELKIPLSAGSFNRTYTVQRGDSLYSISKKFGTPMDVLIAANDLKNPNLLKVGQELIIPRISSPMVLQPEYFVFFIGLLRRIFWLWLETHPYCKGFHEGIDIVFQPAPCESCASGTVIDAGYMGGFVMVCYISWRWSTNLVWT